MTQATTFERTVYVAEYQAKRALAAGRNNDTRAFQRHTGIMHDLIGGSDYPEIGYQELGQMLGRSKAAVLKLPLIVLA